MTLDKIYTRDVAELRQIVQDTECFFRDNGLDPSLRMVVDLATEELFVNMVNYNTETTQGIRIEMSALDNGVEVSLTDYDVERFNPCSAAQVDVEAPLEQREPGGLGIFLVMKMTDSVQYQYRERQSRITFRKMMDPVHV